MDIKIGPITEETIFHYVNVDTDRVKSNSEHLMIAGNIKMQEAVNIYQTYSLDFLCLTKTEKDALIAIFDLAGELNLQLEDEDYVDHTVKFRNPIKPKLSRSYPGCYECSATCVEVGS
ncbi:hypothetical protein ES708_18075 [subsurface metagenome]